MQLNPSLHEYFTSDKIVLKGVKTHDSRYKKGSWNQAPVRTFKVIFFVRFDSLLPSQQFFSYVRTGLPGLNQY